MTPLFFVSQAAFGRWLRDHHASARELLVGFHKTGTGRAGLTYPEAVDEALCWGWIDGVRRRIDAGSYSIRFTPRKKRSIWSAVNLRHVERLKREGRMQPQGLAAMDGKRTGVYSFENRPRALPPAYRKQFTKKAWAWFEAQPPWYRRTAAFWVLSAKKDETRKRRLSQLIDSSAKGRRAPPFSY